MFDGGTMSDERPGKRTWAGKTAILTPAAFAVLEAAAYRFQVCTGLFVEGASVTCFVAVRGATHTIELAIPDPVIWYEATLELWER